MQSKYFGFTAHSERLSFPQSIAVLSSSYFLEHRREYKTHLQTRDLPLQSCPTPEIYRATWQTELTGLELGIRACGQKGSKVYYINEHFPKTKQDDNHKMKRGGLECSPASEFQTGIRVLTILSIPKPQSCHHCGPSTHFLPCAAFTAKEQQLWLKNSKLPGQERKEQPAFPAEPTKTLPNSPMLMWTRAAEGQMCTIFALCHIQNNKSLGDALKSPLGNKALRVAGENILHTPLAPVLGTTVVMRKTDGRYLRLLCQSCIR